MAGLLGILFVIAVPDSFIDRFRSGVGSEGNRDGSAESRLLLWKGAVTMFLERPITGVGMDNYALMSPRYVGFYASRSYTPYEPGVKGPGFVTHSTWFQTIAEGGILTAFPFFLMFAMAWFATVRLKTSRVASAAADSLRANAGAMQGILIAIVLTSSFGSHMKIDFLWWYVGLISAMALIMERERAAERLRALRVLEVPPPVQERVPAGVGAP
jgi:O-antigen ligase